MKVGDFGGEWKSQQMEWPLIASQIRTVHFEPAHTGLVAVQSIAEEDGTELSMHLRYDENHITLTGTWGIDHPPAEGASHGIYSIGALHLARIGWDQTSQGSFSIFEGIWTGSIDFRRRRMDSGRFILRQLPYDISQ
ncbi:MAG: hypothetical protein JWO47_12 [Candidatus Saccharibacteria bacterium]|nr:hypothetical protein [Candidatus Saccharibacteria bacterium]